MKSKVRYQAKLRQLQPRKPEYLKQELALHKNQAVASCDQSDQQEVRPMDQKREQEEKSLRKALKPTIHPL